MRIEVRPATTDMAPGGGARPSGDHGQIVLADGALREAAAVPARGGHMPHPVARSTLDAQRNDRPLASRVLQRAKDAGSGALDFGAHWLGARRFEHMPRHELPPTVQKEVVKAPRMSQFRQLSSLTKAALEAKKKKTAWSDGTSPKHWEAELPGDGQAPEKDAHHFLEWGVPTPQGRQPKGQAALKEQQLAKQPHWVQKQHQVLVEPRYRTEEEAVNKVFHRQTFPFFTVLQVLAAFGLYFAPAKEGASSHVAGLDAIWPGDTDLAAHADCSDLRWEAWRWFTYQFSHLDFLHVAYNSLMVLMLGIPLEGFQGSLRMALMFNVGVFGGACCTFVLDVHTRVVGMSGGVYALIGISMGDIVLNFTEKARASMELAVLVFMVFVDGLQAYVMRTTNVSHSAHGGGLIAGFLIGLVVCKNQVIKNHEKCLQTTAFVVGILLAGGALAWYTNWPPKALGDVGWCWLRQIRNRTEFQDGNWHCVRCDGQECIDRWSVQQNMYGVNTYACKALGGFAVTER
mmetsp:Transcript_89334/g.251504  ORF Transcript_89334/g.251504 Transcript_89334/m.251504 type:complete len:515 (-) Transcript_89334:186-1730(-)